MPYQPIKPFNPFVSKKKKNHIPIRVVRSVDFNEWIKAQEKSLHGSIDESGFEGKSGHFFLVRGDDGKAKTIYLGASKDIRYNDGAQVSDFIQKRFSQKTIGDYSFSFDDDGLDKDSLNRLHIGFGWAAHSFTRYKSEAAKIKPALIISKKADKKRIETFVEAVCIVRDLVNTPANDMGPDELEAATQNLIALHELKLKVIQDKDLLKKNFPMIYEVGKGSSRRPRLLDFSWGDKKHPKVTLVGKGVCFDTGGLDIKPSAFMLTMKKDMGGAAHVIALAHMIINLNLPIQLRVLIPAVENSISGDAFRPSDVINSRKGLTVEVGDTDAEGRLVLGDAIAYACEDKPELLIDFATLTGAARIAVGYDLPASFSNRDETLFGLRTLSAETKVDDPVWPLPLWDGYRKEMDSTIADINSTGGKAGATIAALFLKEFVDPSIEWIHMDVFAWEQSGRVGRPKGGADTGLRAIFALLEDRYGKKKP